MAVLLHVQGAGRDPLRPFGGHAIRTVAWDRFDPGTVGRDVDTIIVSAPDPVGAVDALAALREVGDDRPVLLVPDETPGWLEVAGADLAGAAVVLGGMPQLPDYLPSSNDPRESGVWEDLEGDDGETGRVIDIRDFRVPRGPGRRLLQERMSRGQRDIASAVRDFTADLTRHQEPESTPRRRRRDDHETHREDRSDHAFPGPAARGPAPGPAGVSPPAPRSTPPAPPAGPPVPPPSPPPVPPPSPPPVPPSGAPPPGRPTDRSHPTEGWDGLTGPADPTGPLGPPAPTRTTTSMLHAPPVNRSHPDPSRQHPSHPDRVGTGDPAETATVAPVPPARTRPRDTPAHHGRRAVDEQPARPAEPARDRTASTAGTADDAPPAAVADHAAPGDGPADPDALVEAMTPRRLARALSDPATLVPALLAQSARLQEIADTPAAVAAFVRERVGADAVDIVVADGPSWRTHVTVGRADGAGGVCEVVDVPGLVAWLESFETPVVLDGSDLGAPGSWVLAAPSRGTTPSAALVLAWRGPGGSVFDPAAVSLIGEVAVDAAPSLRLAVQLGQLARAVSPSPDRAGD